MPSEHGARKAALERSEEQPPVTIPPQQKAHEAIAQSADAVIEDDGRPRDGPHLTTNSMRGNANLPDTASMMLIWQV